MDNEMLTLWIKAGAGLACDDARELIQLLADERADHDAHCVAMEAECEQAVAVARDEEQANAAWWEERARLLAAWVRSEIAGGAPEHVERALHEIDRA